MSRYIQNPDGTFAGSVGLGRDVVPTPAASVATPTRHDPDRDRVSLSAVVQHLATPTREAYMFHGIELDVTDAQVAYLEDRRDQVTWAASREDGRLALVMRDPLPPNPRVVYDTLGVFAPAPRTGFALLPDETGLALTDDPVDALRTAYGPDAAVLPVYANRAGTAFALCRPDTATGVSELAGWTVITENDVTNRYGTERNWAWDRATEHVQRELARYQAYLVGECYDIEVIDADGQLYAESFAHWSEDDALTHAMEL